MALAAVRSMSSAQHSSRGAPVPMPMSSASTIHPVATSRAKFRSNVSRGGMQMPLAQGDQNTFPGTIALWTGVGKKGVAIYNHSTSYVKIWGVTLTSCANVRQSDKTFCDRPLLKQATYVPGTRAIGVGESNALVIFADDPSQPVTFKVQLEWASYHGNPGP